MTETMAYPASIAGEKRSSLCALWVGVDGTPTMAQDLSFRRTQRLMCTFRISIAAIFAALCLISRSAAADIPVISYEAHGPASALPLRDAFYLQGKPSDNAELVHLVYVRYSYAPWGLDGLGINSCTRVAEALPKLKSGALKQAQAGRVDIQQLWVKPEGGQAQDDYETLDARHSALVVGPWKRAAADKPKEGEALKWKILTPNDDFFRIGAKYCLFIYETKMVVREDAASVRKEVGNWWTGWQKCDEQVAACDRKCAGQADDCEQKCSSTHDGCLQKANKGFVTAVNNAAEGMPKPDKEKLIKAAKKLTDIAPELDQKRSYAGIARALPQLLGELTEPGALVDVTSTDWAAMLLGLLVRHRMQVRDVFDPAEAPPRAIRVFTDDGQTQVKHLMLMPDLMRARLVEDPQTPPAAKASKPDAAWSRLEQIRSIDLSKLTFPTSEVTMLDVALLLQHRIRFGRQHRSFEDVMTAAFGTKFPAVPADSELLKMEEAAQVLSQLNALLTRAFAACPEQQKSGEQPRAPACTVSLDTSEHGVLKNLGHWLRSKVARCAEAAKAAGFPVSQCATEDDEHSLQAWPGYRKLGQSPLNQLEQKLRAYVDGARKWAELKDSVTITVKEITVEKSELAPYSARIRASRNDWFGSYVTPIAGISLIPLEGDPFAVQTLGIQVFLWPNPVDEPMWTGYWKDEFRRSFALELMLGTSSTDLGPGGRYSGILDADFPPVFLGAAVHLIPYTTLSFGVAFLDRRLSALPQEDSELFVSHYVAASVEANIPDIIAALVGRGASSKEDD